jgi:NAD+ kinase
LDVLFVLGGDGTILMVATECAKYGVKIIGINYGHIGFLTEYDRENVDDAVHLVCDGNYKTVERSILEVECGGCHFLALNDLVIQRATSGTNFSNTVELRADIDGSTVDNFSADGIIVSTPTGSTAYSLSAGGSILTPDINAFIMTPICAHSLHSRPVVYSDDSILEIFPHGNTPLNLVVDGRVVGVIAKENTVTIKKSDYKVQFITRDEKDFFKKLLIKLNKWSK